MSRYIHINRVLAKLLQAYEGETIECEGWGVTVMSEQDARAAVELHNKFAGPITDANVAAEAATQRDVEAGLIDHPDSWEQQAVVGVRIWTDEDSIEINYGDGVVDTLLTVKREIGPDPLPLRFEDVIGGFTTGTPEATERYRVRDEATDADLAR